MGFGRVVFRSAGNWTYSAADSQAAIQQLGAGQTLTDSFTAVASDGTNSELVSVTIHGTNDTPLLGGATTGSVTEDNGADGDAGGNLRSEERRVGKERRSRWSPYH